MSVRGAGRLLILAACAASLGGCQNDFDPYLPREHRVVAGGHAKEAPRAMRDYGCNSCHTIPGVQGANSLVGPPLTAFARRRFIGGRVPNSPEELVLWIRNPQAVKPGTAMPNLGVSDQDARNMAAYLYTLR